MRIYMQFNDLDSGPLRFYHLMLQQDLLGGWFLISESGIQGSPGRVTKKQFNEFAEAEAALLAARDRQLKKGYKVVFIKALNQPG